MATIGQTKAIRTNATPNQPRLINHPDSESPLPPPDFRAFSNSPALYGTVCGEPVTPIQLHYRQPLETVGRSSTQFTPETGNTIFKSKPILWPIYDTDPIDK
jgi:hypothetical protein